MLDMLSYILSLAIIFTEVICCVTLFDILLTKKRVIQNKYLDVITKVLSLVLISFIITSNINNTLLQGCIIILSYFLFVHIFYKTKLIVNLSVSIIIYILIIVVDIFSVILIYGCLSLPLDAIKSNPLYFLLSATFSKMLLFLVVIIIKKTVGSKRLPELKYISKYHWFVYILQSVISLISLLSLIELCYKLASVPFIVIIATFGLLFLNNAILLLLETSARFGQSEIENALYRQQIEVETENIRVLTKTFDTQKRYMHDYKHQISTIYQLISDKKYNQTLNLIKSVSDDIYVELYRIKTNHDIIDAILNQKYLQAENRNVIMDIRAGDLSMIKIPEHLLVTILSNSLDNAIEACENVITEKIITVKIVKEDEILIYSVINPVNGPVEVQDNSIITTKTDKLVHGTGLKNISLALSKCNGDYELGCDGQFFQFTAFIRL